MIQNSISLHIKRHWEIWTSDRGNHPKGIVLNRSFSFFHNETIVFTMKQLLLLIWMSKYFENTPLSNVINKLRKDILQAFRELGKWLNYHAPNFILLLRFFSSSFFCLFVFLFYFVLFLNQWFGNKDWSKEDRDCSWKNG